MDRLSSSDLLDVGDGHQVWDTAELVVVDDAGHGGGSTTDILTASLSRLTL